jgi:hypothetical protein
MVEALRLLTDARNAFIASPASERRRLIGEISDFLAVHGE